MRRHSAWFSLALLLAASAATAAPAPEPKGDGQPHAIPGGVTDEDGAKGFVANDKGGVTALDLATGEVLWQSKTAGRPVSVLGGWVWVQARDKDKANVLHIIGLALDDGRARVETDPIVLPDWASAEPGQGAGRSFSSHAWTLKKDCLLMIAWQADTFYWGGVPPSPERLKAAQKHADGVAQVNLCSNQVDMLETAKAPPPPGPKVSDALRKAASRNYGDDGITVAVAGDYAAAVDLEAAGDNKQKVVLKRWDLATEKPLDPVVLAEGAVYQTVTLPSAGVTLVRDATPPPGAPPDEYIWTVYSLATGKQAARFEAESRAGDFTAIGPRAYYVLKGSDSRSPVSIVLPQTLKAVDLKTGKRLWERPLEGERLPPPPPP